MNGEHDARRFIAMELLEGQTVKQRIAGGRVEVDALLSLGVGIADALDAAHARGIVHHDSGSCQSFPITAVIGRRESIS
ncbi:MAG: hypothetical protein ABR953_09150 [Candidatus Acidiferrales bacterium]|jgi:non-specific serine/threonine protein kinase